jgi:DNA-binding NtrC family response regulator
MDAGRFRPDLFHRLAIAEVHLPPLRERLADIPILVDAILDELAARGGPRVSIPPDTLAALTSYSWPGNVRQLRNVIERSLAVDPSAGRIARAALGLEDEARAGAAAAGPPPDPTIPFHQAKDRLIQRWESEYVAGLIAKHGGNMAQAARGAGIDRAYLYRLMRKYHLHG